MTQYFLDEWNLVADLLDEPTRHHWVLLMNIQATGGWRPYRLCVLGTHRRKRSFYVKRLASGPDQRRLAHRRNSD